MRISMAALALVSSAIALAGTAQAATIFYSDAGNFSGAVSNSFTDDFEDSDYRIFQNNAYMSSVKGQTRFETTGHLNNNLVFERSGNHEYCAGCNGSFTLHFDGTSYGSADGVFGVGLDIFSNDMPAYDALVTFGDNSTASYSSLSAGSYLGVTSHLLVKSIAFGPDTGAASQSGAFSIDNLTVGNSIRRVAYAQAPVPEPASWAMMIGGLALVGGVMRRRGAPRAAPVSA